MKLEDILKARSENKCELCKSETSISLYEVPFAKYKDEHKHPKVFQNQQNIPVKA